MKLTFTKLDTYKKCPLRYRLRYQEKLPEVARGGRNLSLVLHQALRSFLFTARRDASLEALLRAYESRCPLPQDSKQEQRRQEGRRVLESFHWQEGARLAKAVALEQKFSVVVEGTEVTGQLDSAIETEEGLMRSFGRMLRSSCLNPRSGLLCGLTRKFWIGLGKRVRAIRPA